MRIITDKGLFDTQKDSLVILLDDENEYNSFMTKLATKPVKTSGMRVITILPEGKVLNPLQAKLLDIIEGLDGVGGKDTDKLFDEAIDKITDILDNY